MNASSRPVFQRITFTALTFCAAVLTVGVPATIIGCRVAESAPDQASADGRPYIQAASPIEAGRYLAIVGGCNDCHTEGYLATEGRIPEADWMAGSAMGWRGPWGTTYPANLRLRVQEFDEDVWVSILKDRLANPPMPWMNVNQMSDKDARALYRYLQSLGPKGEHVPAYVPPDKEPVTPYILLEPQNMGAMPQ